MIKRNSLTPAQIAIIAKEGTEPPGSGGFDLTDRKGSFLCRACGAVLFRAEYHFVSSCGWPSFDDEISDAVKQVPDDDGRRTEILCSDCDAHLGHIFHGEQLTDKNTRYCVNSISLDFTPDDTVKETDEAIVAGGCFWGIEHLFKQLDGVLLTEVGYTGGELDQPDYQAVCTKTTGHLEALRIVFDKQKHSYQDIIQYFFECHDFSQTDGQGPDLGPQYLSAIFYHTKVQKEAAQSAIQTLEELNYSVATQLYPASVFWPAEGFHQAYYSKKNEQPYCHMHQSIFPKKWV